MAIHKLILLPLMLTTLIFASLPSHAQSNFNSVIQSIRDVMTKDFSNTSSFDHVLLVRKIKTDLFSLPTDQYVSAIEVINEYWESAPYQAQFLAGQLQTHWEYKYGDSLLQYFSDASLNTKAALTLAVVALTYNVVRNPLSTGTYFKHFRSLYPTILVGMYAGATQAIHNGAFSGAPPAPAHIININEKASGHDLDKELEFRVNMDELIALAAATGVTNVTLTLKRLSEVARTSKLVTKGGGRVFKHLLIASAIFWATENIASHAMEENREDNIIQDFDKAKKDFIAARDSGRLTIRDLYNFEQAAKLALIALRRTPLLIYAEYNASAAELAATIQDELELQDRLSSLENQVNQALQYELTNTKHKSQCNFDFEVIQLLRAINAGDKELQADLSNNAGYYIKKHLQRMELEYKRLSKASENLTRDEFYSLKLQKMENKTYDDFMQGRYCHQPQMLQMQLELFLARQNFVGAEELKETFRPIPIKF